MKLVELLKFHTQSLREYAECWQSSALRTTIDISKEEAAYHLLEHAGMLRRYTADEVSIRGLKELTEKKVVELVMSVCKYISCITLSERINELVAKDFLESEEIEEVEAILLDRDGLQTVIDLASELVRKLLNEHSEVVIALADANCVAAEIDDLLLSRPDIISVASRPLEPFLQLIKTHLDMEKYWWFAKAREIDKTYQEQNLFEILGSKTEDKLATVISLFSKDFDSWISAQNISFAVQSYPDQVAAASEGQQEWKGRALDGKITWSIAEEDDEWVLRIASKYMQLQGTKLVVTVGEISKEFTLEAMFEGYVSAEVVFSVEDRKKIAPDSKPKITLKG